MSAEQWARIPPPARAAEQLARVRGFGIEEGAAIHLSALMAALFILGGVGYLFQAWNLLYSTAGVVFGAGYTDVHVRLPAMRVIMVLAFVLARRPHLQRAAPPPLVVAGGGVRHLAGRPDRAPGHRPGRARRRSS